MKRLYIRWYVNGSQSLPFSENLICVGNEPSTEVRKSIEASSDDVIDWLLRHPNGKVDYMWV